MHHRHVTMQVPILTYLVTMLVLPLYQETMVLTMNIVNGLDGLRMVAVSLAILVPAWTEEQSARKLNARNR